MVVRPVAGCERPVLVVGQHPWQEHGLHLTREGQLPLEARRADAFRRERPVTQGDHQYVGQGRDEPHVTDGRTHAPSLLAVSHHHVGDDFSVLLDGNGQVVFDLRASGNDGVGLATEGLSRIFQTRQPGRIPPLDHAVPGPIGFVPTEQGQLANPDALEDPTVSAEQLLIGHITVDDLGQVQQGVRLPAKPFQPFPVPEFGRHGAYFLTRSEYSPVRVSTLMRSPMLMKSGTRTSAPVSMVAGFRVLVAVSPLTPGSV